MTRYLAATLVAVLAATAATVAVAKPPPKPPKPAKAAQAKGKASKQKQAKNKSRAAKSQRRQRGQRQPQPQRQEDKVRICHRTGSQTNPYVLVTVSESARDAHMGHGDTMPTNGDCPDEPPTGANPPRGFTSLTATLTGVTGVSGSAIINVRMNRRNAVICFTLTVTGATPTAARLVSGTTTLASIVPSGSTTRGCRSVSRQVGEQLLQNAPSLTVAVTVPGGTLQGPLQTAGS